MPRIVLVGLISFFLTVCNTATSQVKESTARIAFYNAENFFDPYQDSTSEYNEFSPEGNHHWNSYRYQDKLQHIYKVVAALGGWQGLSIMGFAEIENRKVLEDLTQTTPLQKFHYKIIHYDSPDKRGIDVGLIYQPAFFRPVFSEAIHVTLPGDSLFRTRDILYVKGLLMGDTLHLFVNHWPSRYGGLLQTVAKRLQAAHTLKSHIDSICKREPEARILIIGDMNENQSDPAIQSLIQPNDTYNLTSLRAQPLLGWAKGSIKSQGQWTLFDQMIVSESLLNKDEKLLVEGKIFHIFDAPFLLEKDEKNMGLKPNRSFIGFKYHGGFSDHLPVFVDLVKQNNKYP